MRTYKFALFIFPILLLLTEAGIRISLGLNVWEFAGPTLCVAGMSLLIALVRVKAKVEFVDANGQTVSAIPLKDAEFYMVFPLILMVFLLLWGLSYYLAQPANTYWVLGLVRGDIAAGVAVYVGSCALFGYRET